MPDPIDNPEVIEQVDPQLVDPQDPVDPVEPQDPPEYTPNFTFKVMDEEKSFDDFLQSAVTTKEQEDALRDLYTKAYGLDPVKTKYESLSKQVKETYEPLQQQYQQLTTGLQNLGAMIKEESFEGRNYRQFFDTLKIPNEHILRYAKQILDYQELPPEQRQAYDHQQQLQQQSMTLQQQNQWFQQQLQEQAIQARDMQINMELSKPEVGSFIQEFDKLAGQPGSFRQQVLNEGSLFFQTNQREASPQELVKIVMDKWKAFVPVTPAQPQPGQVPGATPMNPVNPGQAAQAPVIPNVKSTGNSPARKQITSLADIRALKKRMSS